MKASLRRRLRGGGGLVLFLGTVALVSGGVRPEDPAG